MKRIVQKAYAKINIALNIKGIREDGYHDLDMVMLPLKLHDSLLITELKNKKDNFVILDDFTFYIGKNNIAHKAIDKLEKRYDLKNKKFKIIIHKNIPMQAGMGGGSSNAAATLLGIDKFCKLNAPKEELLDISKELGADVPFFIDNVPARCEGIGEIMTPITIKNNYYCLIVKPEGGCSTKVAYQEFDKTPKFNTCDVDKVIKALEEGNDDLLAESISNALQESSIRLVPEIKVAIDELKAFGFKISMMTGSGSAVFALSSNKKFIKQAEKEFAKKYTVKVTEVLK